MQLQRTPKREALAGTLQQRVGSKYGYGVMRDRREREEENGRQWGERGKRKESRALNTEKMLGFILSGGEPRNAAAELKC